MKVRTVRVNSIGDPFFCPNCHRRVTLGFKGNIKFKRMNVMCGHCKNGKVILECVDGE